MKTLKILFLIIVFYAEVFCQSTLEKIQNLNLENSIDTISIYFSSGAGRQADSVKSMLIKSSSFYETKFNVEEKISLAVLNKTDWEKITSIPYGLPFVSGPPFIVCIPADLNNSLAECIKRSVVKRKIDKKLKLTADEIVREFIDMIGFHELGHVYSKAYRIKIPNKWLDEFTATYFAYIFLAKNYSRQSKIWKEVCDVLVEETPHKKSSIEDFEKLYVKVGVENYAWYQAVFQLRAVEVYQNSGIEFISRFKKHKWLSDDENFYIKEAENVAPGFIRWATKYKLID